MAVKQYIVTQTQVWDICLIKGTALLQALLECVIRLLFFCPDARASSFGLLPHVALAGSVLDLTTRMPYRRGNAVQNQNR